MYGHHVMKSGLGRITENTSQYEGVVVYSMNDLPLVWMYLLTRILFFFKMLHKIKVSDSHILFINT